MEAHGAVQSLALAFGFGALVTLVSDRLRQPPILFLLLTGFALGVDGLGLVSGDLLGSSGLLAIVSVSVGLLVFEGGLALDRQTVARAPGAVRGLLTIGVIVSWVLTALLARHLLDLPWDLSILLGSMLIVTGPTVIQPILRRTPLRPGLHATLMAEGILIDPIGVVAAVATLEIVRSSIEQPGTTGPLLLLRQYGLPAVAGIGLGVLLGFAASRGLGWLRRAGRSDTQSVVLVGLSACMIAFGLAELAASEAGLVAATICGLVLANTARAVAEEMRRFKELTAIMLVGALFILLASRVPLDRLSGVGWAEVGFVAGIVLLVRPMAVLCSTVRTGLSVRERIYTALIAPRGIVAIALGAIVAIELTATAGGLTDRADLAQQAEQLETLVILVIVTTVTLAGLLASPLAGLLGVKAGPPNGLIIIGGHRLGRDLAAHVRALGVPAMIVDTNAANIASATAQGIAAHMGNAKDVRWLDQDVATASFGNVLALSDNDEVDSAVAAWAAQRYGPEHVLRWRRDKPQPDRTLQGRVGTALQWGRPLRHLLFQMDAGLARCATWQQPPEGAVPVLAVDPQGRVRLIDQGQVEAAFPDGPPEGTRFVGVHIGPANTAPKAPQADQSRDQAQDKTQDNAQAQSQAGDDARPADASDR